jgi:hypothetical protein
VQSTYNDEAIKVLEAKRTLQAARNARAGAEGDLANWGTSNKNKQLMEQAGRKVNQIGEEVARNLDGASRGRTFDRLEHAEALGANVAAAATAGVGGSGIELFNQTMDLRQALKEDFEDREMNARVVAATRAKGDVLREMGAGMGEYTGVELDNSVLIADRNDEAILDNQDYSSISSNQDYSAIYAQQDYSAIQDLQDYEVFTPDIDYTTYQDHKKMGAFQQVASLVGAGVATYFGGPQAGAAVLDTSVAMNMAQNGDMAGASKLMSSAASGAMGAFSSAYKSSANGRALAQAGNSLTKARSVSFDTGFNAGKTTSLPFSTMGASLKL